MTPRDRRVLLAAAALASVLVLLTGAAGHAEVVAYTAPLLVLGLPLLAGRYVGEEHIARVAERLRRRGTRLRGLNVRGRTPRAVAVMTPRGGLLIASALAERAPPASVTS